MYQSIGAVNTIVRRSSDGKLIGYNTDCEASITAIEDRIKGTSVVVQIIYILNLAKNWLYINILNKPAFLNFC